MAHAPEVYRLKDKQTWRQMSTLAEQKTKYGDQQATQTWQNNQANCISQIDALKYVTTKFTCILLLASLKYYCSLVVNHHIMP